MIPFLKVHWSSWRIECIWYDFTQLCVYCNEYRFWSQCYLRLPYRLVCGTRTSFPSNVGYQRHFWYHRSGYV